jgi:hypothetical protein
VPIKVNDDVYGVFELASFATYEPHEIKFIEMLGASVAATISGTQIAERTRDLLGQSQQQTEQLRAQEEEMRQNMEEMQATQEQLRRQMDESHVLTEQMKVQEHELRKNQEVLTAAQAEISRKYNELFERLIALNYESKFDQLKSITSTKKRSIEYYFEIIRNQILTFSENTMVIDAVKNFKTAFYKINEGLSTEKRPAISKSLRVYYENEFIPRLNENTDETADAEKYFPADAVSSVLQHLYISQNTHPTGQKSLLDDAGDGSEYSKIHAYYHPIIRSFLDKFGYYDIFFIDSETGYMVYSVFKEVDFATNVYTGLYSTTNFGRVVNAAKLSQDKNFIKLIDFEPYSPSYMAPASFIACPIFDKEKKIGILVFQMPINRINQILTGNNKWKEDGLGESGETFMIGSDYRLRSMSRELIENPDQYLAGLKSLGYPNETLRKIKKTNTNILLTEIRRESVTRALSGNQDTQLEKNENGIETLNAFAPLNIPDVHWVIMSVMKESEASMRINDLRSEHA